MGARKANRHGGQTWLLDLLALRLRVEARMLVAQCSYFSFGTPPGLFDRDELAFGLHGGEVETSLMLHLSPELVRREHLKDFRGLPSHMAAQNEILGVESAVGLGWMSQDLHPQGVCGDARAADAARGREFLDYLASRLALTIHELAATPLTTLRAPADKLD